VIAARFRWPSPATLFWEDEASDRSLIGEQIAAGLFGTALVFLVLLGDAPEGVTFGSMPIGVLAALVLSGVILRRIACGTEKPATSVGALSRLS
jgi:hypothetical protein